MKAENIQSAFTKRYVVAVALIALLSSGAFYILLLALKESASTALVVNVAGKQRMLTHQIASLAQQYHYYNPDGPNYQKQLFENNGEALKSLMKEMASANIALSSGSFNGKKLELSYELKELYFGDTDLKVRVEKYLEKAHSLLIANHDLQSHITLEKLLNEANALYPDLNKAVELYQKEGEEKIDKIQAYEILAFSLTILTLLLEVIFIFQPMATKFKEVFKELEHNRANLENEVHARTLKLEKINLRLQHLASHDPLTGLKNRLNMEQELEAILNHYENNHIPFAILMIDIDWFKKINDNYGHDVGDYVLQELSDVLRSSVRDYDSVFRAGGEEFVIIFNRIATEKAIEKAEAIRKKIETHHFGFNGTTLRITISGGLYYPAISPPQSTDQIVKLADSALYEAKHLGRNCIVQSAPLKEFSIPPEPSKTFIRVHGKRLENVIFADKDIYYLTGYSREEWMNHTVRFESILHPDDMDIFEKIANNESFMTTLRISHAEGRIKILRVDFSRVNEGWEIFVQDPIKLAESVEDHMILQNFNAMMENSDDYIYFKDRNHVFTGASRTLVSLTSVEKKEDLVGKTDYEVFPQEFADKYFKLEKAVFSGEIAVAQEIQPTLDKNGISGWVDNRKYPIKNEQGMIIGLFGIARTLQKDPQNVS